MSGKTSQNHRVAVVTGGAGAIGGAIVERLAPDYTVVVLDRTGDFVVDLSDPDDVRRAAKLVLDRHSRCDVFVTQRRRQVRGSGRRARLVRSRRAGAFISQWAHLAG
jgi:nucleoside-diphosphate-sugar epimerase